MSRLKKQARSSFYAVLSVLLGMSSVLAERVSDTSNTTHNLSVNGPGATKATAGSSVSQVCVFCHTPHNAGRGVGPLWNKRLSDATYTPYSSSSLSANAIQGILNQPGGSSKLCLSCHDGTLAIGSVSVYGGRGSADSPGAWLIPMDNLPTSGVIPNGRGANTGYTRNLGIDLSNDHPISVNYTTALADRNGELRSVDANQMWPAGTGATIGVRRSGLYPQAPLEGTGAGGVGQIQCAACHDPHLRETDVAKGNQKFLRLNRFQELAPTGVYDSTNDIGCVACHDKDQNSGIWAYSAHANPLVATQTYKTLDAALREFPSDLYAGQQNLPVWKASCLNCHDTHTVQGSRHLVREGTDSTSIPKAGGGSAIEETCYQCHGSAVNIVLNGDPVPDIKSDFNLARHMPITSAEQTAGSEVHDIGGSFNDGLAVDCTALNNQCGADFVESKAKLGAADLNNRHAECTDCHNPHRVVKFNLFSGNAVGSLAGAPDASGSHKHTDAAGYVHSNIISGALRGAFGVEPVYGSASFQDLPSSYDVKRGDPGVSTSTLVNENYVTREYQICLKCHSNYGYPDDNLPDALTSPSLGRPLLPVSISNGLTPAGTNDVNSYTNQAREFQAPLGHKGESTTFDSGAFSGMPPFQAYSVDFQTNNHRAWHPVMDDTGRTAASTSLFNLPWSNSVGAQTMYCTDCHGSNVASLTSVIPDAGKSWGGHGSGNNFLLKGEFDKCTGSDSNLAACAATAPVSANRASTAGDLCFKCHSLANYTGENPVVSGFSGTDGLGNPVANLHGRHAAKIGQIRCTWCHAAVPHGWKNKAMLVNLNDVGPEAACRTEDAADLPAGQQCAVGAPIPAGTQMRNGPQHAGNVDPNYWVNRGYTNGPYYLNAMLKVRNFKPSGQWTVSDCGSSGMPGNGVAGCAVNTGWSSNPAGTETCLTPP
jgi:Doubled CXXCH motif (Paired_CXXCH_1)